MGLAEPAGPRPDRRRALPAIARTRPAPGETVTSWSGAIGLFASEIIDLTGLNPIALRRFQRDVLVPPELRARESFRHA